MTIGTDDAEVRGQDPKLVRAWDVLDENGWPQTEDEWAAFTRFFGRLKKALGRPRVVLKHYRSAPGERDRVFVLVEPSEPLPSLREFTTGVELGLRRNTDGGFVLALRAMVLLPATRELVPKVRGGLKIRGGVYKTQPDDWPFLKGVGEGGGT